MSDGAVVRSVSRNGTYSFSKPGLGEISLVPGHGVAGDVHGGVTVRHRSRVRADPTQPNLRQVHLIQGELFQEVGAEGFAVQPGDLGENVTTSGVDLLGLPRGTVLRFGRAQGAGGAEQTQNADPASDPGAATAGGAATAATAGDGSAETVVEAARSTTLAEPIERAVVVLEAAVRREAAADAEAGSGAGGGHDQRPAVILTGLRNPCGQIDNFQPGLLAEVAYRDDDGAFVRKAGVMGVVLRGGPIRPGDPISVELPPQPHEALDRV